MSKNVLSEYLIITKEKNNFTVDKPSILLLSQMNEVEITNSNISTSSTTCYDALRRATHFCSIPARKSITSV